MAKKRKKKPVRKKKRGGRSVKQKGNRLEREVAKRLGEWWGEEFHRTPNSGALRWNGTIFTFGDILPPENFPAVIECKSYKSIDLDEILRKPKPLVVQWFDQCVDDCLRLQNTTGIHALPILIWKRTGLREPRICLEWQLVNQIYRFKDNQLSPPMIGLEGKYNLAVLRLTDLLSLAPRDTFEQALRSHLSHKG